ncbi:hypothetical protein AB0I60_37145 [Actinosynnema sp. NPDC050436]|uniref:hypothetical protein n=1 Tax=Actinosynnema sp. NPDC050436 TaxID=3155659 RepID=UPI00340AB920
MQSSDTPKATRADALAWWTHTPGPLTAVQHRALGDGRPDLAVTLAATARGYRAVYPHDPDDLLAAETLGIDTTTTLGDPYATTFLLIRRGCTHRRADLLRRAETDYTAALAWIDAPPAWSERHSAGSP